MILPVLQYPDPRLKKKSLPIGEITQEIRELAANMIETMYARNGIGLAAPQVGAHVRMIVVDLSGPEKREDARVFINPTLTLSGPEVESEEGCLSVKDLNAVVRREQFIHLEALDLDGNTVSLDVDDLFAICLQHECDHLDGILFIDHISTLKRMMYDKKLKKKAK